MAYTKNTWKTGDIVSSQKLNHMEDGIANSENVFIVGGVSLGENDGLEGTLDKTWQEIHDAMLSKICFVVIAGDNNIKQELIEDVYVNQGGDYSVSISGNEFITSEANGYPIRSDGGIS